MKTKISCFVGIVPWAYVFPTFSTIWLIALSVQAVGAFYYWKYGE